VHHPNAAWEEKHVDHAAETASVTYNIANLIIEHSAGASKSNKKKINHRNFRVSGPLGVHKNGEILDSNEISK